MLWNPQRIAGFLPSSIGPIMAFWPVLGRAFAEIPV